MRRIGSAVSDGRWRNVIVSSAGSWISSRRLKYLSSSRTPGRAKCSPGVRSPPRSRPTTVRPALVSSRAMMLPVQPMPTMTASTSFKRVAMAVSSRKIGDRLRLGDVALTAILLDCIGVSCRQAGEAHHLPGDLVAVAAIDRIGKETFHDDGEQRLEELLAVEIGEFGLSAFQRLERLLALCRVEPIEILAISLARPCAGGGDAGGEKLARRQRELIALLRLAFEERPAAVHLGAAAPGARQLPVDESGNAAFAARGGELVGRNERIGRGGEEGMLSRRQGQQRLGFARSSRSGGRK